MHLLHVVEAGLALLELRAKLRLLVAQSLLALLIVALFRQETTLGVEVPLLAHAIDVGLRILEHLQQICKNMTSDVERFCEHLQAT